ncbi:MAG TPA: branched-chain amino acid ABC transporter permease [bacterium]|nr:branched-chain amino acid ABC transporter permease [bacterium]
MSDTAATVARPARAPMRAAAYLAPLALLLLVFPYIAPAYQTILLAYGLAFAIAALALNLLLGYTGLLSFGHAAFFGAGAYAAGFMVKYLGVTSMEAFLAAGALSGAVIASLFGIVCVRYTRIFFSILALALSQVLWSLAFKLYWVTGGSDGLRVPTPTLLGGVLGAADDKVTFLSHQYYYYTLVIFAVCAGLMWLIVHSPFGQALQAIRDNEVRAEFVGIRVRRYRWIAFVLSGMFTGVAGTLWGPLNGLATPEALYWPFSGEIVFMAVLGGFRSFSGPIVGAVVFNYLKAYAVGRTEYWQLLIGVVLVILVLAMPEGIIGTLARVGRRVLAYGGTGSAAPRLPDEA